MKTIKLILKGILLYTTIIITLLYVMGIDSIYDNGLFIPATLLTIILIFLSYIFISSRDMNILSGYNYLKKSNKDIEL